MLKWGTIWDTPGSASGGKKFLVLGVALVILAAGLVGLAYFYYAKSKATGSQPASLSTNATKKLLEKISELIVLPQDEEPTIATVADPEQLKDQPFFAKAQKGFKVLIYTNAKKAILYDPVSHKIVEVAPLNIGDTAGIKTEASP